MLSEGSWDSPREFDEASPASSGNPLGGSLKSYGEKTIAATEEFLRKLSEAKNFQEAMRIHAQFIESQFEQTRTLGEAYARSAEDPGRLTSGTAREDHPRHRQR